MPLRIHWKCNWSTAFASWSTGTWHMTTSHCGWYCSLFFPVHSFGHIVQFVKLLYRFFYGRMCVVLLGLLLVFLLLLLLLLFCCCCWCCCCYCCFCCFKCLKFQFFSLQTKAIWYTTWGVRVRVFLSPYHTSLSKPGADFQYKPNHTPPSLTRVTKATSKIFSWLWLLADPLPFQSKYVPVHSPSRFQHMARPLKPSMPLFESCLNFARLTIYFS